MAEMMGSHEYLETVRYVDLEPGESLMVLTGDATAIVVRAVEAGTPATEGKPEVIRAQRQRGSDPSATPQTPPPVAPIVKIPWVPKPPDRTVRVIDDIRSTLWLEPPEPSPRTEFGLTGFIDVRNLP